MVTHNKIISFSNFQIEEIKIATKGQHLHLCDNNVQVLNIGIFLDGTGNSRDNTIYGRTNNLDGRSENLPNRNSIPCRHRGSYSNGHTNIERLERIYKDSTDPRHGCGVEIHNEKRTKYLKRYFEGSGTKSGEDDPSFGQALGIGSTGCLSQVHKACEYTFDQIRLHEQNLERVVIDVFGFSRGATSARHFANCINSKGFFKSVAASHESRSNEIPSYEPREIPSYEPSLLPPFAESPHELVNTRLIEFDSTNTSDTGAITDFSRLVDIDFRVFHIELEIRFVGLFDTVASIAEFSEIYHYWIEGDADAVEDNQMEAVRNHFNGNINVHLSNSSAEYVYHIVAEDEFRPNFSLFSLIEDCHEFEGRAGNIDQISVPGSHADVGGSYQLVGETLVPLEPHRRVLDPDQPVSNEDLRQWILDAKRSFESSRRYRNYAGALDSLRLEDNAGTCRLTGEYIGLIVWTRPRVSTAMQQLTRKLMIKMAMDKNVPFLDGQVDEIVLPADLQTLYSKYVNGEIRKSTDLSAQDASFIQNIRKTYVHYSSKYAWHPGVVHEHTSRLPECISSFDPTKWDTVVLPEIRPFPWQPSFVIPAMTSYPSEPFPPLRDVTGPARWMTRRRIHKNYESKAWG